MQVRFDGTLGFPGGIVDEGETPEGAVTRELLEEMGGGVSIEHSDHVMTTYSTHTKFILHFYAKKVSMETFRKIEEGVTKSKEWGSEVRSVHMIRCILSLHILYVCMYVQVMGVTRCPLYTLPNGLGFPGFLACNFIGSSREQLLETLKRLDLLSEEEITRAIELSKQKVLVTKETIGY